jgi:hypothetical protein
MYKKKMEDSNEDGMYASKEPEEKGRLTVLRNVQFLRKVSEVIWLCKMGVFQYQVSKCKMILSKKKRKKNPM